MKADRSLLNGSASLLVLSLLASEDMYGYQMIAQLEERSDHTFSMKEGTLYPILHNLEKEKAVTSYEKEAPTGRMRKYYHITKGGLRLLEDKKQEWTAFSQAVNAVLAGPAPALAGWPPPALPSGTSAPGCASRCASRRTAPPFPPS